MLLFKRYEVLLPVRYNDGTPVEDKKFQQTWGVKDGEIAHHP